MAVGPRSVVSIEYTLTDPDGQVLDTSEGRAPLVYLHGSGGIIPGLEKALEGREAGDELNVTVEPAEAYGERDEGLVQRVPRTMFQGVSSVEVGMQFTARSEQGMHTITVVEVADEQVTVDANHPLAGVPLTFEVRIVEVRDATAEELAHGHAHGPGGHHHH